MTNLQFHVRRKYFLLNHNCLVFASVQFVSWSIFKLMKNLVIVSSSSWALADAFWRPICRVAFVYTKDKDIGNNDKSKALLSLISKHHLHIKRNWVGEFELQKS